MLAGIPESIAGVQFARQAHGRKLVAHPFHEG
jgi:hypothetical protein